METWPTNIFPHIHRASFSTDQTTATIRTEMDSGRAVQRKRFDTQVKRHSVKWSFTDFQWAMFQSWFTYRINLGADWFYAKVPSGDGLNDTVKVRFFNAVFKSVFTDYRWEVSAVLETDEPPVMDDDTYTFFESLGESLDLLELAADGLHHCVHSILPSQLN